MGDMPTVENGTVDVKMVQKEVIAIVSDVLGVDENTIQLNQSLVKDLSADSLDVTELIISIEEHFNVSVTISDKELAEIDTVQDLVNFVVLALKNKQK